MEIGILVSFMNNFGQKGLYNSQEIGLAKALVQLGNKVTVYKLLKKGSHVPQNETMGDLSVMYSVVRNIGANGIVNSHILSKSMEKLIYFSDTQLAVPSVYKWCRRNNVTFIPYIGVVESHSDNPYFKKILDFVFLRNISIYKKINCLVKTNDIKNKLSNKGVSQISVAPVGIDFELLNSNYANLSRDEAKENLGVDASDIIVLLVGRIENDRNSMDAVRVFEKLHNYDKRYKLLVVGKGTLKERLFEELKALELDLSVVYFEQIPNDEMWKIYRASDILISFSKTEIFGMSILEAMYYGTEVHAITAPGPNDIIENHVSGYLYDSADIMRDSIITNLLNRDNVVGNAQARVKTCFTWKRTAEIIENYKGE